MASYNFQSLFRRNNIVINRRKGHLCLLSALQEIIRSGQFCVHFWARLVMFYQTGYEGEIWICNPITKKTLALPVLSDFAGKACLGYASSTNEYKIVVSFEGRVDNSDDWTLEANYEEILSFNILTLKLEETSVVGSWRDLLLSCTQYSGTCHQPVHINGLVYWLAFAKDNTFSSDRMTILEMNLENEEVNTLCFPNGYNFGFSHLAEINGHLCFVHNKTDSDTLNAWMLKDRVSEAWCLEYSIEVPQSAYNYTILGYLPRNNESTGDILIQSLKGNLFCYETDTQKFKELQSLNKVEFEWCGLYYESLFSIGMPGN
ncbi:hypothetical protein KY285_031285 [Solanum tuberosum]|nr:hypothetical protein KY285_031285 [Solanum tuberosum]